MHLKIQNPLYCFIHNSKKPQTKTSSQNKTVFVSMCFCKSFPSSKCKCSLCLGLSHTSCVRFSFKMLPALSCINLPGILLFNFLHLFLHCQVLNPDVLFDTQTAWRRVLSDQNTDGKSGGGEKEKGTNTPVSLRVKERGGRKCDKTSVSSGKYDPSLKRSLINL